MTPRFTATTFALLIVAAIGGTTLWRLRDDRPIPAAEFAAASEAARSARTASTQPTGPTTAAGNAVALALPPRRSAASAFLPELRQAADAGDPVAACRLAVALGRCSEVTRIALGASMGEGAAPVAGPDAAPPECRGASAADLDDRYRYQAQAFASGDAAAERWFVTRPMLGDDDFRMNTPKAIDFRRRAPAYVAHALQRKQLDDLVVLLQVYMPPGYFESSSPLRLRDDAMFLALADVAERAGVGPEYIRSTAAQLRSTAGSDVLALSRQRAAQLGGPWRASTPDAPVAAVTHAGSACDTLHH